jgi:hypothetical protein
MTCEQFTPKPLILNDRYFYLKVLYTTTSPHHWSPSSGLTPWMIFSASHGAQNRLWGSGPSIRLHKLIGRFGFPDRHGIDDRNQLHCLLLGIEVCFKPLAVKRRICGKLRIDSRFSISAAAGTPTALVAAAEPDTDGDRATVPRGRWTVPSSPAFLREGSRRCPPAGRIRAASDRRA